MRTRFVICSLLLISCVVSGAVLSRSAGAQDVDRAVARAAADVATPAPASVQDITANPLQLDPVATPSCSEGATSDAASCATGGWAFVPELGCCAAFPTGQRGKWRHGSQIKCCGACAVPD
jgi:hypothetical protein